MLVAWTPPITVVFLLDTNQVWFPQQDDTKKTSKIYNGNAVKNAVRDTLNLQNIKTEKNVFYFNYKHFCVKIQAPFTFKSKLKWYKNFNILALLQEITLN